MAQKTKFREIPVFEKEDSSGINRLFAFLSYFFPIGTLIMWIIFRKKSKYVRMHTKRAFGDGLGYAIISLIIKLPVDAVNYICSVTNYWKGMEDTGEKFAHYSQIAAGVLIGIVGFIIFIIFIVHMIQALCGKCGTFKSTREIVIQQLALGNPEAVEIIKTDDRFADLLAKYNANQARMQQAANNSGNTNTPNGDAK